MNEAASSTPPSKGKAPAIARAVAILRLLGRSEKPLGVQAIARELELVPSTCLYVLRALVEEQLVAVDPNSKLYRLDAGVLSLARGWLKQDRFADIVQPELDLLAQQSGVSTMAVQIVGLDHIIVIGTAQGSASFQLSAHIGSRFPALISATGRCIAAFADVSVASLQERFSELRWDNPPTFEQWLTQIGETRTRGFAVDDGFYMAGATVLAAPVFSQPGSAPGHALVALGMEGNVRDAGVDMIGEALRKSAAVLSSRLESTGG
ncbi:IclR family transcriptional regulator [Pontixanthobacter aquaemixtae]|uniref:Helix-turn-helix domain-containing protein n=1 Tax=Pontixanthobacter aquaemixtae TaxID=1958940 RepID=A0A844ZT12_9SPHN|nr:IclR family transcriptional regulator [Pontixanthobacter aquaemixtae]MXO89947.1 helix-turn-helix domain-containing protein [Pontixanthobacter aquaemixtae]